MHVKSLGCFFLLVLWFSDLLLNHGKIYAHTLSPKLENQIIDRKNFKPNLDLLDPEADPDLVIIKVADSPLPLTVTEAREIGLLPDSKKNVPEILMGLGSLEDVLDLSDILVVLAENAQPRLLSDLAEDSGNLIAPDELRNPWKIIDHDKGLVFDLQSHFIKISSSRTGESSLIPISIAVKKGIISEKDALIEIKTDLEKELLEHKKFVSEQNTNDIKKMRMKRYDRTIRFLKRPDVLPLRFTLNAYGNEIVGDYDQMNNMSFGRAGEGIYVYNFNGDLEGENEVNDGRFFIRGKYIGLSGDINVGDTIIFPWLGYRAGKLKIGLFGSVDTGFLLNSLYLGGILRIGKGELAAGLGIFVTPFRFLFFPGILLGSTVMRKKIRDVEIKRVNPFKVLNEHYEVKLNDKRGKFFRFTLGLGDPFFGFGIRSRWTDEQAKKRSYQSGMGGNLARTYHKDGKRINLTRFGRSTFREQLPSFVDPSKWEVGTEAEFEKMKDKQGLSAFGNLIIPAGVNLARQRDLEEKIRFKVKRRKNNKIDVQFIQNVYLEKGGYGSLVEVFGKLRSRGSSQILVQKLRFDLDNPQSVLVYRKLIKNGIFPKLLDDTIEDYIGERNNLDLLKFLEKEKQELKKYGITRLSTEWVRPNFKKRKYIAGFQLLGVPGYSGERTVSEAPLKQINENGVWERDLISIHDLKETPRARFKSSSTISSLEYFEHLNEHQEVESDFYGIRGEWNFSFTKVFGDNIPKLVDELNRYMPGTIDEFAGEGKDRTLALELVLDPEDIESLRQDPDISLADKIWQIKETSKEIPRKAAIKFIDHLNSSSDQKEAISHIRKFLVDHPAYGMGFLALLSGKQGFNRLATSSRIYEKPFRLADEYFLNYSDFDLSDQTYHVDLDTEYVKFFNKFFKKGLYILDKIDLAFMEIQNDPFLKQSKSVAIVYDESWSKEELQARLWLLKRQVKQFMERLLEESELDVDEFLEALKPKNRDLKNKIIFYRAQIQAGDPNKKGKSFYDKKYSKYLRDLAESQVFVSKCPDGLPDYERKVREDEFQKIDELLNKFKEEIEALP